MAIRNISMISTLVALVILSAAVGASADTRVLLSNPSITVDPDQSSFVCYAVEELTGYLKDLTSKAVPIGESTGSIAATTIVVGPNNAERVLGAPLDASDLGEEGYILKTTEKSGQRVIIAAGAMPRGTMAAVYALMRSIRVDEQTPYLPEPLDVRTMPAFATRGLHFNGWPFNYPHSFRRWTERDWQNYLDVLASQGVNLFYFWPFMEIMPVPLSPEDKAYLAECRRIIDYAQTRHGMEVWIMQCTNRVAKDNCGVADPKARPYWRPSQQDLKPSDPKDFAAILASREVLYRALDNTDGVCNIDSDPGFCDECPIDDYVKVLKACRSLLDQYNQHGKQAKLMAWMWMGWGRNFKTMFNLADQERTILALNEALGDAWDAVPGTFDYLALCRKHNLLSRSSLLPYGLIESEPSYPMTNVGSVNIRKVMNEDFTRNLDMPGAIGNVQTPLLQLPHIHYFMNCLWNLDYRQTPEKDSLLELGRLLYPDHAQLIADCYLALKSREASEITPLADKLDDITRTNRLGRLGVIGRKLFPDHRVVAQAIVLQLRLRAGQERLFSALTPETSRAECTAMLLSCLDAYLAWDQVHGWHDFWGWTNMPLVPISTERRYPAMTLRLAKCLRDPADLDACLAVLEKSLSARYPATIVERGCIAPLRNTLSGVLRSRAPWAKATASVAPAPGRYPPEAANDGSLESQYWPGALVQNNEEWLQLTWDSPETIRTVVVRFLKHPSMIGRAIRLQREISPGKWENLATTMIPEAPDAPHAVATFDLPAPIQLDKIRIVNLLDVYEVEVN